VQCTRLGGSKQGAIIPTNSRHFLSVYTLIRYEPLNS